MTAAEKGGLDRLVQALDQAIALAAQGNYPALLEQNREIERQAAELERIKTELEQGQTPDPGFALKFRQVQQKVFTLSEVLRHVSVVSMSLLGLAANASGSYNSDGQFSAPRGRSRLHTEA